jgi:hypothetical protein
MIEVRQTDSFYNWSKSNVQMVVDELKANHFDIELDTYHRTDASAISCGYSSVKIPIIRGDFKYTLILSYCEYDIKKEKIKFDAILEDGKWKGVFFDIEKVIAYYEKWDKRNKQKIVRENVSQFKGPLVLSYIRGTLDEAGIEYKEEKSYSSTIFKTNTYSLAYREPPPGELAKLNMERVELILTTNDKKVNYVPVPLKKFVENVEDNISKLSEIVMKKELAHNEISKIRAKYKGEIEKIETQLTEVVALGYKESQNTFDSEWKDLFHPKKKK